MDYNTENSIDINDIEYGAYQLTNEGSFNEAFRFTATEFNRLYTSKVRLPDGKNNIVYLLSSTFEKSIDLINHNSIVAPFSYKKVYYPMFKQGTFLNRRYRINFTKQKLIRNNIIKERTNNKRIAYPNKTIPITSNDNLFFVISDIYDVIQTPMKNAPINRLIKNFYTDFIGLLESMAPDIKDHKSKEFGNRILLIDADEFKFTGGSLSNNKTNLLFLLYLSFLRSRNNMSMDVNIDMIIISNNLFMKFNPSIMTPQTFNKFRTSLFRIMKSNMDNYTTTLPEDEQLEITTTSNDIIVDKIIDKRVDIYTKYSSPAIKTTMANAVSTGMRINRQKDMALEQLTKITQKEISTGNKITSDEINKLGYSKNYKLSDAIIKNFNQEDNKNTAGKKEPVKTLFQTVIDDIDADPELDKAEEDDIINLIDYETKIAEDIDDIIRDNEIVAVELVEEIQQKVAPLNSKRNSPINGPLDEKLRNQQKKVVIRDSTIEEILAREKSAIPIQSEDKSAVLKTLNSNMKNVTFSNFDKTYIEEMYNSDLVSVFDSLKDKNTPFYITSVNIEDTSTALDLKETWTVKIKDETNKSHTIKVDIPKFYQNKFLWLGGNRKVILKQNLYNPIVKDTPDTVIITTNYNKITVNRKDTKSFTQIENLFQLINKLQDDTIFIAGNATSANSQYISTLEYDELSKMLFKFNSKNCELYFNRNYITESLENPSDIKGNEFLIGYDNKIPILINEDTGRDRDGRTIIEIIYSNLPDEYKASFDLFKPRKQAMYAEGKLLGKFIPVIITLIIWKGISKSLDNLDIRWEFHKDIKKLPKGDSSTSYIKFQDGILEYELTLFSQLMMNGLLKLNPDKLTFDSLNDETGYIEYLHSIFGTYTISTQFRTFYEFLIDPITKDICKDLFLPETPEGLLTYAVRLLADNEFVNKASDKSYRVRSVEIIPAILYNKIAAQYTKYINSGRRIPFSLPQNIVIKELLAVNTVEDYSTLNPAVELGKIYTITARGYKGSNTDNSYDKQKRSYDESSIGKLAMSTPNDANVGINKELVLEPTIVNARGLRAPVEDIEDLRDVNIFSPVELMTPGTIRSDEPIRSAIAGKQTRHLVPTANASPSLVSNGFDEAMQFHLSSDFVVNAEEDGEVVEVNNEVGFIIVKYKSGKTQAININPEIVKNGGGGFYLSNTLTPIVSIGSKFKKDEVLAYHDKYFRYSKLNGLRFAIGPLVKCAFISTYNTYEDAGICTEELSDMMKTFIVYKVTGSFKRNSNIVRMVKVGDHINIGDSLIKYDTSYDDTELNKIMAHLSNEDKSILEEVSRNDVTTDHAGTVVDIKIFTLHDPSNLSPTLGNIVSDYFKKGLTKKELLSKYDSSDGIIKAGYLLTDNTEPVVSRYNDIKGVKTDVLIEFYIEHGDVAGVGDKIIQYSANKQIISEIIPAGFEPYAESRPDEPIHAISSPGTLARRHVTSVIPVSMAMKCLIELKRKIAEDIKYK